MKAELRKETPTGRVGAPRCFALVRLASPCGERDGGVGGLCAGDLMILGAKSKAINLLAILENSSCEGRQRWLVAVESFQYGRQYQAVGAVAQYPWAGRSSVRRTQTTPGPMQPIKRGALYPRRFGPAPQPWT